MSWRKAIAAPIFACLALQASPARAQSAPEPAAFAPIAVAPRSMTQRDSSSDERTWYGWQTLLLDGTWLTTALIGAQLLQEERTAGVAALTLSASGYLLAAPAVHLLQQRPGNAARSLGIRVGLPLVTVGLVSATSAEHCPASNDADDDAYCEAALKRMAVAGALSMVGAAIIDGTLFSYAPREASRPLALTPMLGWDGKRGAAAGLTGVF